MSLPSRKILIVDDSPEDRETWRRFLAADVTIQYVFVERGTVESGLAACRAEQPECILLDHNLPDGTGVDFINDLRELGGTAAFPTVMLTGTGSETVAVEAMKAGAQDYLVKNRLTPDALHRTLNGAIYKAQTDRLLAKQRGELEEAYRQAKEANARKDQFLARLSHELRTPLTPILAAVSAPDAGRSSGPELEETFRLIRRNVELEARLIDDLLDITRISHGKLELDRRPVDLHELIHHALEICRPTAQAKGVAMRDDLKAARHGVRADPARLQQVFWNLLNNAIKFTPAGGEVMIGTHDLAGDRVEVEVTDNGMGITPERLGRIFDAFEQGDAKVTREFGGLGLGLAICKALVEAHGGEISASSPGLNQGAVFRVALASASVEVSAAAETPAAATAKPATEAAVSWSVLLVEDHADSARVLVRLMSRRGYKVFHASSVAEAEALYRSEPVDVIVSDLGLPDGNGLDLIKRLQTIHPAPSIVLSGYGEAEAQASSLGAGVLEHLTKPVEWTRLEAVLRRVLGRTA